MSWSKWLSRLPRNIFVAKFSRSSGPGGQNVNKVSSKVLIRLPRDALDQAKWIDPIIKHKLLTESAYATKSGDILVSSELTRSQKQNLEDCYVKFAKEIERLSFVPASPSAEAIERWSTLRRREDKKRREMKQRKSQKKQDRKI